MLRKKSKVLLVSAILGTLYSLYLIIYFSGGIYKNTGAEQVGAAIAVALVTPHMILVVLAAIFNWIAYVRNKVWAAVTAGILYSVGGVIFLIYFLFVVPMIILSFVGASSISKVKKAEESA